MLVAQVRALGQHSSERDQAMIVKNLKALKGLDTEKVAKAIEADAGQALPGLRESLAEAQAGLFAAVHTAVQIARHKEEPLDAIESQYRWVKLSKHCEVTGDTPDAVHARRRKRIWTDGIQCRKGPDGNLYINPKEYNKWVEGEPLATPLDCNGERAPD